MKRFLIALLAVSLILGVSVAMRRKKYVFQSQLVVPAVSTILTVVP